MRILFQWIENAFCAACMRGVLRGVGEAAAVLSDGQVQLDDWNEKKKDQPELYSLPLQELNPRNLRLGIYRGGRRPVDLYRRIFIGIKGAKMPAVGGTLKSEEIWQLVDYVRSLPYQGAAARLEESEMFLKNR